MNAAKGIETMSVDGDAERMRPLADLMEGCDRGLKAQGLSLTAVQRHLAMDALKLADMHLQIADSRCLKR